MQEQIEGASENKPDMVLRYVAFKRVDSYRNLGWIAHPDCLAGTPHGAYSCLMEWPSHLGAMVEPTFDEAR
jgi:hypothetical protein